jgi:thiamine pyrophosphate-dependent acetolactate synthase large subunit-like protein
MPPFNVLPKPARETLCEADLILALDWIDLAGAMRQARAVGTVSAKVVNVTLDHQLHNGFNMDHQSLPPADVLIAAGADTVVTELNEALGRSSADKPWRRREPAKKKGESPAITLELVATELRAAFDNPEQVSFATLGRAWPVDLWPFRDPLAYLGKDGGGGIGSGPGLSIGAALALQERGRYTVAMLGDGDFVMGGNALWTAARHKIPLLILINNNRSYFNDELHQETVAVRRDRNPKNRWIGQRIDDPAVDIAKLAEAHGAVGIGPVTRPDEVKSAIRRGVDVLKAGGVCVIDLHVEPGEERRAGAALGARPVAPETTS